MAPVGALQVALLFLASCSLWWRLVLADAVSGRSLQELESGLITFSASEAQSFSDLALAGTLTRRVDGSRFDHQKNHPISASRGQKWKRISKEIVEWVLQTCVVVLTIFAIYYTVSCICACCIGLDILAEIWRVLGGFSAFSYFVRVERAVVETDPEPLPLLRTAAEEP